MNNYEFKFFVTINKLFLLFDDVQFFQVRVPTHEDGSCLFWEFASDYYDIGFGVFFEWTIAPSNTVSVHVSESSDEEEIEEEEQAGIYIVEFDWSTSLVYIIIQSNTLSTTPDKLASSVTYQSTVQTQR